MIESVPIVRVCAEVIGATIRTSFNIDYITENNTAVGKCLIYNNY